MSTLARSTNAPVTVGWSRARRSIGGNMSAPTASGTNRDTLDEVDALVADGRALYAIDLLEARARHRRRRHARTPARIRPLRGVRAARADVVDPPSGRCGSTISTGARRTSPRSAATTSTRAWSDATSRATGACSCGACSTPSRSRASPPGSTARSPRAAKTPTATRARRRPGTSRCRSPAPRPCHSAANGSARRVAYPRPILRSCCNSCSRPTRRSGCATSSASTSASARSCPRTSARCGGCRSRRTPTGTRTVRSSAKESAR